MVTDPQKAGSGAREMPHSYESEVALLGSVMLRPSSIDTVRHIVQPGDFYRGTNRTIYEAMVRLSELGDAIDVITLNDYLEVNGLLEKAGGVEYLADLSGVVPTSHNIESYARIIADKKIQRDLVEAAYEVLELGYSSTESVTNTVQEAEEKILSVGERETRSTVMRIDDVVRDSLVEARKYFDEGQQFTGVPTGFEELDKITNGFQPGELIIIAARPSMGKSAFALNIASNVALAQNMPVVVFTLEMSATTCGLRMLSALAKVDLAKVRSGETDKDGFLHMTEAGSYLSEAPIYIDDSGLIGTEDVRARCRRIRREAKGHKIGMILVDYIQLMRPRTGIQSREQQISDISRSLKFIAKEFDCPVVALSQLNRGVEGRDDKRPRLSDIRESGAVEQDADVIAFIYRHEYYHEDDIESRGKAEILVRKNRNGPTKNFEVVFLKQFGLFANPEFNRDPAF